MTTFQLCIVIAIAIILCFNVINSIHSYKQDEVLKSIFKRMEYNQNVLTNYFGTIDKNIGLFNDYVCELKANSEKANIDIEGLTNTLSITRNDISDVNDKIGKVKIVVDETVLKNDFANTISNLIETIDGKNHKTIDRVAEVIDNGVSDVIKKIEAKNSSINKMIKDGSVTVKKTQSRK